MFKSKFICASRIRGEEQCDTMGISQRFRRRTLCHWKQNFAALRIHVPFDHMATRRSALFIAWTTEEILISGAARMRSGEQAQSRCRHPVRSRSRPPLSLLRSTPSTPQNATRPEPSKPSAACQRSPASVSGTGGTGDIEIWEQSLVSVESWARQTHCFDSFVSRSRHHVREVQSGYSGIRDGLDAEKSCYTSGCRTLPEFEGFVADEFDIWSPG